jgi:hypothetical protein
LKIIEELLGLREKYIVISLSLELQESSGTNKGKHRPHHNGADGHESDDDPPEHKPSKVKRR